MKFEQVINYYLNSCPKVKRVIKRLYQRLCYLMSSKIKAEGDVSKVLINTDGELFFGYYDKSPWDASGRYLLCMRANNTWSVPDPLDVLDILVVDTHNNTYEVAATSRAWNVQQGCMAQWLGPNFDNRIIYNDLREGKYCSVVLDVVSKEERVIPFPVYSVSTDGKIALSLDFSRLHTLRPGYGYAALQDKTKGVTLPLGAAIWRVDIDNGTVSEVLSYKDFVSFEPRSEMLDKSAVHKVNHIMISPNGERFMVLYRWFCGSRKYSRLITCNIDGSDMFLLSDDDMVSHCYWKDNHEIIAFENKKESGQGYYLMKDKSKEYTRLWKSIARDGHPSYCPADRNLVLTDTYPNNKRIAELLIAKDNEERYRTIARVFAPFRYDNDTRCDLHPRWSRDGRKVCFDAVFEGYRGLYTIDISPEDLRKED